MVPLMLPKDFVTNHFATYLAKKREKKKKKSFARGDYRGFSFLIT